MTKKVIVEDIAKLITEEGEVKKLETPSQVFSQVLMHNWNPLRPVEEALAAIAEYGERMGLDPQLLAAAEQYTTNKYQYLKGAATASQIMSQAFGGMNTFPKEAEGIQLITDYATAQGLDPTKAIEYFKGIWAKQTGQRPNVQPEADPNLGQG